MAAFVLSEVPNADISTTIAGDQFSLVGVDDNIINWNSVRVVALNMSTSCIPDLDCSCRVSVYSKQNGCNGEPTVFRRSDHPFSFAVESHTGYITGVALKGEHCSGIRGFDIIQFDGMMPGGSQEALVRTDT